MTDQVVKRPLFAVVDTPDVDYVQTELEHPEILAKLRTEPLSLSAFLKSPEVWCLEGKEVGAPKLTTGKPLGQGGFGTVLELVPIGTATFPIPLIVKLVKPSASGPKALARWGNELSYGIRFAQLAVAPIIAGFGLVRADESKPEEIHLAIVMQALQFNLHSLVKAYGNLDDFQHNVPFVASRILHALQKLSLEGVDCTDLKLTNIVVNFDKDNKSVTKLKLVDFDFCRAAKTSDFEAPVFEVCMIACLYLNLKLQYSEVLFVDELLKVLVKRVAEKKTEFLEQAWNYMLKEQILAVPLGYVRERHVDKWVKKLKHKGYTATLSELKSREQWRRHPTRHRKLVPYRVQTLVAQWILSKLFNFRPGYTSFLVKNRKVAKLPVG